MRLSIRTLAENKATLAGAEAGRRLFAKLVAAVRAPAQPEPVFLDFSGISIATSSFFRESVVAFRDYARRTLPDLYPVIANAEHAVAEEFAFFLNCRGDAFWACDVDKSGRPTNVGVIGKLDEVQRATFDRVLQLGSASAPALAAQTGGDSGIGPTAWNNRLANLASLGLLIERRGGKTKIFAPVLKMI
jgi:hypothetical protein